MYAVEVVICTSNVLIRIRARGGNLYDIQLYGTITSNMYAHSCASAHACLAHVTIDVCMCMQRGSLNIGYLSHITIV